MRVLPTRSQEVDTEKCVRNMYNYRFDMVLIAAQRTRELKRQNRAAGSPRHVGPVDALLEIQNGQLDYLEYMRKIKTT